MLPKYVVHSLGFDGIADSSSCSVALFKVGSVKQAGVMRKCLAYLDECRFRWVHTCLGIHLPHQHFLCPGLRLHETGPAPIAATLTSANDGSDGIPVPQGIVQTLDKYCCYSFRSSKSVGTAVKALAASIRGQCAFCGHHFCQHWAQLQTPTGNHSPLDGAILEGGASLSKCDEGCLYGVQVSTSLKTERVEHWMIHVPSTLY